MTVRLNSSSCSLELVRIIDAVAARWRQLVAEVDLGGEYLAVCLQHLQASWKEAPHVQLHEVAGGEEALGVHLQEWVQLRTCAAMAADRATVTCCSSSSIRSDIDDGQSDRHK